jgi:hypothetical protein
MAQNDKPRTRAKAWDIDAARRRAGIMLPAGLADTAGWLRRLFSQWALAEVAPGRLVPWLPVAFGFGIVGYFTADREPAWWAAAALVLAGITVASWRAGVRSALRSHLVLPRSPPALRPRRCEPRTLRTPSCRFRLQA